jgi:hypothetical protein
MDFFEYERFFVKKLMRGYIYLFAVHTSKKALFFLFAEKKI